MNQPSIYMCSTDEFLTQILCIVPSAQSFISAILFKINDDEILSFHSVHGSPLENQV